MEEKCSVSNDSFIILSLGNSRSPLSVASATFVNKLLGSQAVLYNQRKRQQLNKPPSTSHISMSILEKDFDNSQHPFAEVLDEETTTSRVLETFEISSSNSLPTCSDVVVAADVAEAVDDGSSTDTIKSVRVSDATTCNNEFFNASEVFIINDDEEDEDDNDAHADNVVKEENLGSKGKEVDDGNESTACEPTNTINNVSNGVIVTYGGDTIYLETPVTEEQEHLHSQIMNIDRQLDYIEKAGKPRRLSDEFNRAENDEEPAHANHDEIAVSPARSNIREETPAVSAEISTTNPSPEGKVGGESQHDKMSFRLKKMNINNPTAQEVATFSNNRPSISQLRMTDIESMDLIERCDFEKEQRLTDGIILKSSSIINKNMLNLNLIQPCIQQQQLLQEMNDDVPSGSVKGGRTVSSDSKYAYNDPSTTPTSSRIYQSRLTKSTAKLNLCATLSHPQKEEEEEYEEEEQSVHFQRSLVDANDNNKTSSSSSTNTTPSSVIVEAPSTSSSNISLVNLPEVYSSSNSNDSFIDSNAVATAAARMVSTSTKNCHQQREVQQHSKSLVNANIGNESGCSRTSPLHSDALKAPAEINVVECDDDDAQPSTSSARCQYAPPPKSLRQVHASAQTNERYLSRGGPSNATASSPATVASAAAVSLSLASRIRRRPIDGLPLGRNSTSEDVIAAFKVAVAEAEAVAAAAERSDFSEGDSWADCEENSDFEEICTCHLSVASSHGGSNISLNDTDDMEKLSACGGGGNGSGKDGGGDLSNYIQMVSISEEGARPAGGVISSDNSAAASTSAASSVLQRKRKYNDCHLVDSATFNSCGDGAEDLTGRKRIAYDFSSVSRSSSNNSSAVGAAITSTQSTSSLLNPPVISSPVGRRTPRSIIPSRENPPPELQSWLSQFLRWSHAERLLAVDLIIEHCEPTQVRHMMKVIEPQFQRDFISLLPRELALQVLAYLDPKDLLRAAQTCRSWRFLCDDNLLWKEKCRKAQILTEPSSDRPKRGRAGNMPPIASPWKAAYMRQHIIEMNWRGRPVREPKVLKGHDDHVITCLQFSGNRIVSGSDDNTLKVWSAVTGRCLRTLIGHTGGVWSSQMSGNIIISGSTDRTLKVWNMETGHCVHTLLGHTSTVRCMHLHGNKVVSGSRDATLRVWDIDQGNCLHVLVGHLAAVRCVQYDGKLIVSGAYDYMVKIWHPERQECLHTLQGHTNRVYSLQFDGAHVVSGSLDTSIRVWDVETGNCKHTLMGHQSLTSGMELRQNILVSGNADSTVKVWDITTGQCLQTLSGPNKHQSAVTCLQFNSRFVVTSSDDGTVKLWDVKTGEFIRNLVALGSGGSGGVVWRIRANDTKLICAVGSRNGTEETKLMVLDFDVEGLYF